MSANRLVAALREDRGSIIPLALGFFLLALIFVGGGVAFSDVFTKQRDLQAICDGAAVAAANNLDRNGPDSEDQRAVPLVEANDLVRAYLSRDPALTGVRAATALSADGRTVRLTCQRRNKVAFGALILRADGVEQTAYSSAEARLNP
jgi:uncharacterized membrane protein